MKALFRILLASFTAVLFAALTLWCFVARPWRSAEGWMSVFYSYPWPEDMQMDPLILAGDKVVPLVIARIRDPDMPKRSAAIWFLGCRGYQQAKPELRKILDDERENPYTRGYALIALYQLNRADGLALASSYARRQDPLGNFARQVLQENDYVRSGRTYFEAFIGAHE